MRARGIRQCHHGFQPPTCKSRYRNLCAFASALTREKIDIFAWEDIMTTAFNRVLNNMPSRMPGRDNGGSPGAWWAYLYGAKAWVDYDVIQKSLLGGRISHETWRLWQNMFTEANNASQKPRNSLLHASREIGRALEDANGHNQARRTRRSYTPRPRLFRIPAST